VPPVAAAPLSYERASRSPQARQQLFRNVWLPLAFGLLGFFATAMWVQLHGITQGGLIAFALVLGMTAVPVVLVIIGWGILQASKLGPSIGSFAIAALKILSIIVMTDAGVLWVFQFLLWVGAIDRYMSIRGLIWILVLVFACVVFIIRAGSVVLFNFQDDDFVAAGPTLAMIAWGGHFVLFLVLFVALAVMARSAQNARVARLAAASATPAAGVTSATTAPASLGPTAADRQIMRDAYQNLVVREARDWGRQFSLNRKIDALVEKLYAAGAVKVYISTRGSPSGRPTLIYIELPADPAARSAFEEVYQTYQQENALAPPPPGADPPMQKFMAIHLLTVAQRFSRSL
jgi:hypothetical protein